MKIKSAVLERMGAAPPYAQSRPLVVQEVELDPPGPGEVLVRIAAAGLCHSDLSVINGDRPRPTPMALGHEAAGVVEELGPGVDDLAKGDHVVMVFVPSCGHCLPCAEGRPALCEPGGGGQRRRHAAVRRAAAAPERRRRSTTISASRRSPSTRRSRAARWSGSTRSCRSTRRRCSAARC